MSLANVYVIRPKDAADNEGILIGPIPLISPPPDTDLLVGSKFLVTWRLVEAQNNTYNVFISDVAKFGKGDDIYRWANKENTLIATVHGDPPAVGFRFETAGDDKGVKLYTIGIFGKDLVLTYDKSATPKLTFKPANGSSAQRFKLRPSPARD